MRPATDSTQEFRGPEGDELPIDALRAGVAVGPFWLEERIGEGGFGEVWRARQERPLRRRVAIKVLKRGLGRPEVVRRFHAERQALALMDHPNIAQVFDAGATDDGRPWFALELIGGATLLEYADATGADVTARIALFLDVCQAVQHAHQKGVVHRDLKPSNVLVADVDGRPVVKVIDFGIAKAIDARLDDRSLHTQCGALLGTPAYMSPEQIGAELDIDTRTDVYALGVLLYELLCGQRPFEEPTGGTAGLIELQRRIREDDPVRPSTALSAHATGDARCVRRARALRGDLDWITMRCLEKDRERRYGSVAMLATDLRLHLAGDPVLAGPPSWTYRLGKLGRRYRTALAAAAAIALVLLAAAVYATAQARRAHTELGKYEAIAGLLQSLFSHVDPDVARDRDRTLLCEVLAAAADDVATRQLPAEVEATLRHTFGTAYYWLGEFAAADPHLRRALRLRRDVLGAEHLETLEAANSMGVLCVETGRSAEAVDLLVPTAAARARLLGAEHADTLSAECNAAVALRSQDRLAEAEQLLRHVVAARTTALGADHALTLSASSNLATVLDRLGLQRETLPRYRDIYQQQLRENGADSVQTWKAMNNLALAYQRAGDHDRATDLLARVLAAKRERLPPDHRSILVSLNNLGLAHRSAGALDTATALLDEALARAERSLPADDIIVFNLLHSAGMVAIRRQRPAEAEPMLRRALAGVRQIHGEEHRRTRIAEHALAEALYLRGEHAETAELAEAGARAADQLFPAGDPGRGIYRILYGLALWHAGADDARAWLQRGQLLLGADGPAKWHERANRVLTAAAAPAPASGTGASSPMAPDGPP